MQDHGNDRNRADLFKQCRSVPADMAARMLGMQVRWRGSRGWALCPLHGEKTASLMFDTEDRCPAPSTQYQPRRAHPVGSTHVRSDLVRSTHRKTGLSMGEETTRRGGLRRACVPETEQRDCRRGGDAVDLWAAFKGMAPLYAAADLWEQMGRVRLWQGK